MPGIDLPNMLGFPGPRVLTEVLRKWQPEPGMFLGASMMPVMNHPVPVVEWDEYGSIAGLTAAHSLDSDPKLIKMPVRKHHTEASMYFKESQRLNESDILNIRAAGTYDRLAGEAEAMRMAENLNLRLEARLEFLRWQTFQGGVSINENGVVRSITYSLGGTPTAGTLWSTVATADPISDLQAWVKLLRGKSSGRPSVYYNQTVAEYLSKNEKVRELVKQSSNTLQLGTGNVGQIVSSLVGGIESMNLYDGGYLDETSGNFTPFIGENKVVIVGKPPLGQTLGAFKTTPTVHNGGLNPRPGKFMLTHDNLGRENPYYQMTAGIYGVPCLFFPEVIVVATVA